MSDSTTAIVILTERLPVINSV